MNATVNLIESSLATSMSGAALALMAKHKCKSKAQWAFVGGLTLLNTIWAFNSAKNLVKEKKEAKLEPKNEEETVSTPTNIDNIA